MTTNPARFERIQEQLEAIRNAFLEDPSEPGITVEYQPDADGEPDFFHQDCAILVPDEHVDAACRLVGAEPDPGRDGRPGYGERLLRLREPGARNAIETVRRAHGPTAAAYHHIISVASNGGGSLCPADEPDVPDEPTLTPPRGQAEDAGAGVTVRVIDTGLVEEAASYPTLAGVTGGRNLAGIFDSSRPYRGHGTFIAGVLRQVAPMVNVRVDNDFYRAGALRELELQDALGAILDEPDPPDVISLSAGGYFDNDRCGAGLRAVVRALLAKRDQLGKPVIVAAAGNDGRDGNLPGAKRFLPAGLPGVVAVGALRKNGSGLACFTNHGNWVDVYAPGERLVNLFYTDTYRYVHRQHDACQYHTPALYEGCTCVNAPAAGDTADFNGVAEWSGTSFATPIVAGLIAARMTRSARLGRPETAREAARWLLAHPHTNVDGHLRVLLPDQSVG